MSALALLTDTPCRGAANEEGLLLPAALAHDLGFVDEASDRGCMRGCAWLRCLHLSPAASTAAAGSSWGCPWHLLHMSFL